MMSKLSQKDILLKHLREHGSITNLDCYEIYKITDLAHAIYLLRKENFNITDKWEKPKKTFGYAKKYKRYTLVEN